MGVVFKIWGCSSIMALLRGILFQRECFEGSEQLYSYDKTNVIFEYFYICAVVVAKTIYKQP